MTLNELIDRLQSIKSDSAKRGVDLGNLQVAVKYNISARHHGYRIAQYGLAGRTCFRDNYVGQSPNMADPQNDYVIIEASDKLLYREANRKNKSM